MDTTYEAYKAEALRKLEGYVREPSDECPRAVQDVIDDIKGGDDYVTHCYARGFSTSDAASYLSHMTQTDGDGSDKCEERLEAYHIREMKRLNEKYPRKPV